MRSTIKIISTVTQKGDKKKLKSIKIKTILRLLPTSKLLYKWLCKLRTISIAISKNSSKPISTM